MQTNNAGKRVTRLQRVVAYQLYLRRFNIHPLLSPRIWEPETFIGKSSYLPQKYYSIRVISEGTIFVYNLFFVFRCKHIPVNNWTFSIKTKNFFWPNESTTTNDRDTPIYSGLRSTLDLRSSGGTPTPVQSLYLYFRLYSPASLSLFYLCPTSGYLWCLLHCMPYRSWTSRTFSKTTFSVRLPDD